MTQARRAWTITLTVITITVSAISSLIYWMLESTDPVTDDYVFSVRATLGLLAALGAAAALVWRHRHPVLVTAIAIAPPLLFVSDAYAALAALAALAASRRDRVLWAGSALVFAATAVTTWRDAAREREDSLVQTLFAPADSTDPVDVPLIGILLIAAALTAIPLGIGLWNGARRDLTRRRHAEAALRADLARQDERSRIAREMHDVLGHRLSLLSLQAGALEVSDGGPGAAEAAQTIRRTARESLDDLRQVIGVLHDGQPFGRASEAGNETNRPQPVLADLPDLVAATRQSGLAVNVTMLVDGASSAPIALGTAAYRIVQEALTNAVRHAPDTAVDVTVRGGPDTGLAIEVVNALPSDLTGETQPMSEQGTGLIGISERAATLGGTSSAGPTDEQTFAVSVWLPWSPST
jgi:signal transduction histidine kinase